MLEIKQVSTIIGKKKIINNATFSITSGSIVGLIGPNGAGKTTIMKSILGLTKFNGEINLNNQKITENDHHALEKVGALIEHPAIYPFLTGTQNLSLYSTDPIDMQHIITLLGMNKYIDQKAKEYSLGMKQKLGIGIALLNHPQLVILDEPMNGLDIEATILIRKIIKEYAQNGCSFLISSHILSELQKVMTEMILINNGKIILTKPMSAFLKTNYDYYVILTDQPDKTKILLTNYQITSNDRLIVKRQDIKNVQKILFNNGINLLELVPQRPTLERTIVNLLKNQEVKNHA
ncbi:mutacin ABC transporter, ATP-binding protein MutF family protein [Companilactobacillus paralimentarius DSM 13238 = JCM 10415]|jgi:ABC-type multidrug transport system, ATPase component|uniref:Mutacin ABC transporter, ATP-binding protein MutF family protein n=1 Tax=Companilactobacillus paralimentarius DSM 13238 = JCM 10415 TaxID=1122151 RepID=A0A0R1PJJ8_9LACO|nr:ABC transporter ATP-binding protein [Companilactobacillus paralimentarius]KAE9565020.1 ABC transporter [Companilactobacillus paralimentarius]KRL32608.1 mutacin ABC transporter, ATP-binding protein MutF family protein [Companilactobacillus paralimentarius DSM 13238 = JCM 10415]